MRKPVFGISDQVILKLACSAVRRLICAFVVRIWQKQVFSCRGSNKINVFQKFIKHDQCSQKLF